MILGRFYFRQTQNGNLLGEFSNQTSPQNHTESADLITSVTEAFIGDYNATWFEGGANTNHLRIFPKPNSNNQILLLEWTNASTGFVFRGEGFIVDGILIGNYWDRPVNRRLNNIFIAPFNDSRP